MNNSLGIRVFNSSWILRKYVAFLIPFLCTEIMVSMKMHNWLFFSLKHSYIVNTFFILKYNTYTIQVRKEITKKTKNQMILRLLPPKYQITYIKMSSLPSCINVGVRLLIYWTSTCKLDLQIWTKKYRIIIIILQLLIRRGNNWRKWPEGLYIIYYLSLLFQLNGIELNQ